MTGNHNSGRKPKYVTVEKFDIFLGNDFKHLKLDVRNNKWLLRAILIAVIASSLVDRIIS